MKNRKKHYSADKILDSLNKKVWYNTVGISMQDVVCLVNLFLQEYVLQGEYCKGYQYGRGLSQ